MSKLDIQEYRIEELLTLDKLEIPRFQRKMVWKNELRQDLIYSITNSYPIGAITLFENDNKYYLIDGLQRISTLKVFLRSPREIYGWNRLQKESFFKEKYSEIINNESYSTSKKNELKKGIKKWYEEDFAGDISSLVKFTKYFENISLEELEAIKNKLGKIFLLGNIRIPTIIYEGTWSEAAEIFEKMNSGSVTLSKYEIYAATWSQYKITYLNDELAYYLYYKYSQLESLDIENDNDNETSNLFELFLACSYKICDVENINYLIPKMKTNSKSPEGKGIYSKDELFFDLVSVLFTNDPQRIYQVVKDNMLIDEEEIKPGVESFLIQLSNIIKEEIEIISRGLNGKDKITVYYQALYNIIVNIRLRYEINKQELIIREYDELKKVEEIDLIKRIDLQKQEEWFVGQNRQKTFLIDKLNELDSDIKGLNS